ncbi:MAG: xanthine phosphoribosyltransferase [Alphaproteobacteria bacterium]
MTERQIKPFPISWDEFHRHAKALAWRLDGIGEWTGLVAVTRGGLVPALVVARELGIKHIETVCVSSYHGQDLEKADILKPLELPEGGKGWLIVDDLVDTGHTARIVRKMLPNAHYATVYSKPKGREMVDTFVTEFSQDTWLDFPWDIENQLTYAQPIREGAD